MTAFRLSNTLTVAIKYAWRKKTGTTYFRKRIPKDLRDVVNGTSGFVTINLGINDPAIVAGDCDKLDRHKPKGTEISYATRRGPGPLMRQGGSL